MNSKTLSNFHRFGKVGGIVITILMILAILMTAMCLIMTLFVSALSEDALSVRVTEHAEFRIGEGSFDFLWGNLADQYSYAGDSIPEGALSGDDGAMVPSENQDLQTALSLFGQYYASARIHSDGGTKVVEAASAPTEYRSADMVPVLAFFTLRSAAESAALFLLKRLFAVLAKSESPFCDEFVKKLKAFGFSLLPVALFATIGVTLSTTILTVGRSSGLQIQWGVLLAFAVTMCLVAVFRYGVQLQKESDETL